MMSSQWAGQINSSYPVYILADKSNPDVNSAFKYYSEVIKSLHLTSLNNVVKILNVYLPGW